jgi:hypothetical protein
MTTQLNTLKQSLVLIPQECCLTPQQTESLPSLRPADSLVCTCGILWVTQAGDPDDYLLQKGDTFVVSRPSLVVVQAFTQAAYRLSTIS